MQEREQWTDGANAFALSPGKIIGYDCNRFTLKELENNGYKIISPDKYHVADVNSGYRTGGNEYCTVLGDKKELRFELQWRSVEGRFLRPDQEPDGDELSLVIILIF